MADVLGNTLLGRISREKDIYKRAQLIVKLDNKTKIAHSLGINVRELDRRSRAVYDKVWSSLVYKQKKNIICYFLFKQNDLCMSKDQVKSMDKANSAGTMIIDGLFKHVANLSSQDKFGILASMVPQQAILDILYGAGLKSTIVENKDLDRIKEIFEGINMAGVTGPVDKSDGYIDHNDADKEDNLWIAQDVKNGTVPPQPSNNNSASISKNFIKNQKQELLPTCNMVKNKGDDSAMVKLRKNHNKKPKKKKGKK